jgi:hypothetical protein
VIWLNYAICGEWKDNTYHGVGSYYDNGQLWYWGEWKLGEVNGYGIVYDQYGTPTECYTPFSTKSQQQLTLPEDPAPVKQAPAKPTAPPSHLLYPDIPVQEPYPHRAYLPNNDDTHITIKN